MVRRSTIECRVESQNASVFIIYYYCYTFTCLSLSYCSRTLITTLQDDHCPSLLQAAQTFELDFIHPMVLIQLNSLIYSDIFLQLDIGLGFFVELQCL
jgi:hypothetical protein